MKALDQLKKYLPSILYTLLGLLVFFLVVKVIMRLQRSSAVLGDVAVNSLENAEISKETGVAKSRINECRGIAHDVAYELETLKDMGFFEKVTHFQSDSDTIAILGRATSIEEMKLVKTFYAKDYTTNNNLLNDLKKTTLAFSINSIPFITGLK